MSRGRPRIIYQVIVVGVDGPVSELRGTLDDLIPTMRVSPTRLRGFLRRNPLPCVFPHGDKLYCFKSSGSTQRLWDLDYTSHSPSLSGERCEVAKGLTFKQIAQRTGYSLGHLSNVSAGKQQFSLVDKDDSLGYYHVSLANADA